MSSLFESRPCARQARLMRKLGFELTMTDDNLETSCWNITHEALGNRPLTIKLNNDEVPTGRTIVANMIRKAFHFGRIDKGNDLQRLIDSAQDQYWLTH